MYSVIFPAERVSPTGNAVHDPGKIVLHGYKGFPRSLTGTAARRLRQRSIAYNEKKPAQVRAFIYKRAILPLNKTVDRYLGHLGAQFIIYFY